MTVRRNGFQLASVGRSFEPGNAHKTHSNLVSTFGLQVGSGYDGCTDICVAFSDRVCVCVRMCPRARSPPPPCLTRLLDRSCHNSLVATLPSPSPVRAASSTNVNTVPRCRAYRQGGAPHVVPRTSTGGVNTLDARLSISHCGGFGCTSTSPALGVAVSDRSVRLSDSRSAARRPP